MEAGSIRARTPFGGAYSEAVWLDDGQVVITEYAEDGTRLAETWGSTTEALLSYRPRAQWVAGLWSSGSRPTPRWQEKRRRRSTR